MVDNQKQNEPWWRPAILMFSRLSGWVIAPVIIGSLIGMWIDSKYHSDPWGLLVCVGTAFIISIAGIIKNAMEEYNKIDCEKKKREK